MPGSRVRVESSSFVQVCLWVLFVIVLFAEDEYQSNGEMLEVEAGFRVRGFTVRG